jgi:hypothetical protein
MMRQRLRRAARRRRAIGLDAGVPLPPIVYRWDLDKTYLKSDFESLRKMMRVPFERAADKVDAPGVVALIRALKDSARAMDRQVLVYFLTASPPQIGRAIREKLELDGVEFDGIVFKDQLHHLVRGRFRYLREQVGFKLAELLKGRLAAPPDAIEFLFGDDWESDPVIYSLYADTLAGRLDADALRTILLRLRIDPLRLAEIDALVRKLERRDVVQRIFINLERRTPPGRFESFGARLVPTFNYFQTALVLYDDGVLPLACVADVGRSLIERSGYTRERLWNSLEDLRRRGYLPAPEVAAIRRALVEGGVLPPAEAREPWLRRILRRLRPSRRVASITQRTATARVDVDYPSLIESWLASGGRAGGSRS